MALQRILSLLNEFLIFGVNGLAKRGSGRKTYRYGRGGAGSIELV